MCLTLKKLWHEELITSSRFITYTDSLLTVDVLGGVDTSQVERMVCKLRITYKDYPPQRSTLDLYNDNQVEKLQRTFCDKWKLKLIEVSRTLYELTLQLEEYGYNNFAIPAKLPFNNLSFRRMSKKRRPRSSNTRAYSATSYRS